MKIGRYDLRIQWLTTGIREPVSIDWICFLDEYKKWVKRSDRVLEIGSSHRPRTVQLAECCRELVGLELMPERKPGDFGNVKFMIGNWEKLSEVFPENSFDTVAISEVLEHVEHDDTAMNELYRALKPGGTAVLTTPNINRVASRIERVFKGKKVFPWFEHFREYTEDGLRELMAKTPFKKYEIQYLGLGITGWKLFMYMHPVPERFRGACSFFLITAHK
jgi:SAM-dependent methyltransferase